ncbi:MAG: fibronectin type III domain-containing protein, partial [Candidatus Lokiarchaeota archaeon]|nr:fibronectin type III domain-containing protein [Candidatus Lokiarchaeota archaeon]
GVGEGSMSNEASATPVAPATVPGAPQNLVAVLDGNQVILTWEAPASDGGSSIIGYRIYRGLSSGGETLLTTVGNVLTFTDDGSIFPESDLSTIDIDFSGEITVYYFVVAVNAIGNGPASNEASVVIDLADPSVPGFSVFILIPAALFAVIVIIAKNRKMGSNKF